MEARAATARVRENFMMLDWIGVKDWGLKKNDLEQRMIIIQRERVCVCECEEEMLTGEQGAATASPAF